MKRKYVLSDISKKELFKAVDELRNMVNGVTDDCFDLEKENAEIKASNKSLLELLKEAGTQERLLEGLLREAGDRLGLIGSVRSMERTISFRARIDAALGKPKKEELSDG